MKLYMRYFSIHVRSIMQYKSSFFMTIAGQFLLSFSAYLVVWFMMERYHEVQGFDFREVSLCFAIVLMAFSLAECFARGFDTFPSVLGNGEFDRIMVRPRGLIFQVLAQKVELSRLGRLAQAAVIFTWAIPASDVVWTLDKILTLILMLAGGVTVFSGLFLIYAALCFFTVDGLEFMNIFTDGGREFGRYPFSIYGESVLRFLTFGIPLALFQYYPLLYLTGRSDNLLYMFTPVIGGLFLIPCLLIWRLGVRHFKSTGS
jgi:ABC-2 type transport system permease protein